MVHLDLVVCKVGAARAALLLRQAGRLSADASSSVRCCSRSASGRASSAAGQRRMAPRGPVGRPRRWAWELVCARLPTGLPQELQTQMA
eukprot:15910396-Heterocapsa_arctica.AAC.1